MLNLNRYRVVLLGTAVIASAIDIVAILVLRRLTLSGAARVAIALVPLPGDIALIVLLLLRIRRLDEFQKRVQFEAITVAFLSTAVAVFAYGCLQLAHVVDALNTGIVWAFMLFFYALGYFVATSHYR